MVCLFLPRTGDWLEADQPALKSRSALHAAVWRVGPNLFFALYEQRPSPCMQMQCGESRGSASPSSSSSAAFCTASQ